MRVFPGHTDLRLIAGVVFGALAFFAGAFFVTGLAVNHWIEKDSATHSKLWAETLASHIPDLQQIAEGVPPSTKALDQIEMAKGMGKVFRFKVFDRDGRPRLVSDVLNRTETAMPQAHCFLASELALKAEAMATRLGHLR